MAMFMVLAVSVTTAFAAVNDNSGKITINDAVDGHTYNAYQILVLESYDTGAGAYSYKANGDWATWLATQTKYVSIDDQGYVTWVKDADVAAFAKAALAHAEEAKIQPKATATAAGTTVQFTGLNLGYYLVDTTVGSLCSLDTTTPNVEMNEKNEIPPVKKEVKEDSTGNWGEENTAEIGQTVEFKTTIGAKPGAESYVLHDVMSNGLTLDPDSIEATGLTKGQDATSGDYHVVTTGLNDGCTFEVVFHQSYLDTITTDTDIVVTYDAVVNENAQISPSDNPNSTTLKYGEASKFETVPSETKTYTFKVDVVKTDEADKFLDYILQCYYSGAEAEFIAYESPADVPALHFLEHRIHVHILMEIYRFVHHLLQIEGAFPEIEDKILETQHSYHVVKITVSYRVLLV